MKRLIALWGVLLVLVGCMPAGYVKAAETDTTDLVTQGEAYVLSILTKGETPEKYEVYLKQATAAERELVADQVDALSALLNSATSDQITELNGYVTQQTTSVYTTLRSFCTAYDSAQQSVFKTLAATVDTAITNFLQSPLTRARYNAVQSTFDSASKHVQKAVLSDNTDVLSQIKELLAAVDTADKSIALIPNLTSTSNEDTYEDFRTRVKAAKRDYGLYESKFTKLRTNGKYLTCLPRTIKTTLLSNYSAYEKACLIYDVEDAYDVVKDSGYTTLDSAAKENLEALQDAVDAGSNSTYALSVYAYYRTDAIRLQLQYYDDITTLEELLTLTGDTPTSSAELTAALRAYRSYNAMTEEEKELIPEELVTKLNKASQINTDRDSVIKAIDAIGTASSDTTYTDYLTRYEAAYKAYSLFVNNYSGMSDAPSLITNSATLDSATDVIEMIKSIRQIGETEDATMCSKKVQIEGLLNKYARMTQTERKGVYNISVLQDIYSDVEAASDLRSRIDTIRSDANGYTLLDAAEVTALRQDYNALSERAQTYFGATYLSLLQEIETSMDAQNINQAYRVSTLIEQIGDVDAKAKERIERARTAYDGLSADQQAYVSNYDTLKAAEETYNALDLSVAQASVYGLGSFVYSGLALTPAVTVKLNDTILNQGVDYTVTYSSNTNIGTAQVHIKGIGYYEGTLTKDFTIVAASVVGARVGNYKTKYSYTGKAIKPSVSVTRAGRTLKKGTDFTVSYKSNKNRGIATITITGIGNYTGSTQVNFSIVRRSVSKAKVSNIAKSYLYTGKKIKPNVKLKLSGITLKKNTDYLISYKKNKKRGTATISILGIGNYKGTRKIKFKIV